MDVPADSAVDTSFATTLRRYRLAAGLSQAALAERAGLSERAVNDLERDPRRLPRLDSVTRLAGALALAPEERARLLTAARPRSQPPATLDQPQMGIPARPAVAPVAGALPIAASPFVGRAREVAAVAERLRALRAPETRLLTLTGPGGIGKTRLALAVAAAVQDSYADGARCVRLEALRDPALVLPTIAATLGVAEAAQRTPAQRLEEALRGRRLLLVLDNFEQVSDAATEIEQLLAACPGMSALVTSRAPLRLAREREYPVPPLATPDPERLPALPDLLAYDAVALLVERARAGAPEFALTEASAPAVAAICARLEGAPLAIQLAAARLKLLTPAALLARLDQRLALLTGGPRDAPERQRTIRATLDWSARLLTEPQRTLFRRVAVFAGGWTLEAAEGVCAGAGVARDDVLDLLGELVDQSLALVEARDGGARYRLLETVRQYALEALRAAGKPGEEEALRDRHLAWFLQQAEQVDASIWLMSRPDAVRALEPELDNFRAALAWSQRDASGQTELRLAGALTALWAATAVNEGRRAVLDALARAERADPGGRTRAHGRAALTVASLSAILTDPADAVPMIEQAIVIFRELGDEANLARALTSAARVRAWAGDSDTFTEAWEEALRICRTLDHPRGVRETLWQWGDLLAERGEYAAARRPLEESAALCRTAHDTFLLGGPLNTLARVACAGGDTERARALATECLALRETSPDWMRAVALISLGEVERCAEKDARAAELFGAGLAIFREQEDGAGVAWARHNLGHLALRDGDGVRAQEAFAEALATRARQGYANGVASDLAGIAGVWLLAGENTSAARLFGAAEALLERSHTVLAPADLLARGRDVAALRARLDAASLAEAWAAGRALTLEEAVREALEAERYAPIPHNPK